jgi:hypothetical protein
MRTFARDFAEFAGWKGVLAGVLVLLGVFLESLGLLLLVPLLGVVTATGGRRGWLEDHANALFVRLDLTDPTDLVVCSPGSPTFLAARWAGAMCSTSRWWRCSFTKS